MAAIILGHLALGKGGSGSLHGFSSFAAVAPKSPRTVGHRQRLRRLGWGQGPGCKHVLNQMPSLVACKKTILTPKAQRSPFGNGKPSPINCCPPHYFWISEEAEFSLNFSLSLTPFLSLKRVKGFGTQTVAVNTQEGGDGLW